MKKLIIFFAIFLFAFDDINFSEIQNKLFSISEDINVSDNVDVSKYRNFNNLNMFAFKKNYFMPFVYDSLAKDRKKVEAEFQLSIMIPIFTIKRFDFFFGYTMHSVWQVYDKAHSSPFRDTNHEPQLFLLYTLNSKYKDFLINKLYFGIIHQSNGRDIPLSRSWNRLELGVDFKKINLSHLEYSIHFWKRVDGGKKSSASNPEGDDNPHLTDYIGDGYIKINYHNDGFLFELTHQNRLNYNINRGNTLIEAIVPSKINRHFKWYLRYFYGYGNSLIDYNKLDNRFGIGIYVGGEEF